MKKLVGLVGKKKEKEGSLVAKVVLVGQFSVRVEAIVGEGGFATIYRCVDMKTGVTFALKHMRLAADTSAIKEVQQEAKTMARLKGHPNVLKLHAVAFAGPPGAETDGFMLLDFCPTTLLETLQRANFTLDDFLVYEVFQDVARAVAHMHTCKPPLAHRDLKAENVLKNSEGRWVICDFGSSTSRAQVYDTPAEIAAEEDNIRRTTTPAYRAPEMWDLYARQRIDTAVDVWALGVLLYVLAFGKLPFQGDSKLSILYGKYDMPPGRPAAMRSLIQDMLQVNPVDRPDIFQVLSKLDALRAVLVAEAGGTVEPAPPPPPPPSAQPAQPAAAGVPSAAQHHPHPHGDPHGPPPPAHYPQPHAHAPPQPGTHLGQAGAGAGPGPGPGQPPWPGAGPPGPPGPYAAGQAVVRPPLGGPTPPQPHLQPYARPGGAPHAHLPPPPQPRQLQQQRPPMQQQAHPYPQPHAHPQPHNHPHYPPQHPQHPHQHPPALQRPPSFIPDWAAAPSPDNHQAPPAPPPPDLLDAPPPPAFHTDGPAVFPSAFAAPSAHAAGPHAPLEGQRGGAAAGSTAGAGAGAAAMPGQGPPHAASASHHRRTGSGQHARSAPPSAQPHSSGLGFGDDDADWGEQPAFAAAASAGTELPPTGSWRAAPPQAQVQPQAHQSQAFPAPDGAAAASLGDSHTGSIPFGANQAPSSAPAAAPAPVAAAEPAAAAAGAATATPAVGDLNTVNDSTGGGPAVEASLPPTSSSEAGPRGEQEDADTKGLGAQVQMLSAANVQLEARVRQLEGLVASQGELLYRLASELHTLQQQRGSQQGSPLPAPPPLPHLQQQQQQQQQQEPLPDYRSPALSGSMGRSVAVAQPEAADGVCNGLVVTRAPSAGSAAAGGSANGGAEEGGNGGMLRTGSALTAFDSQPWVSVPEELPPPGTAVYPTIRYADLS